MKIALVTTWGATCGISTYSEEYVTELLKLGHEVTVLAPAEPGSCLRDAGIHIPTVQCWNRQTILLPQFERILGTRPGFDLVHFQHEHGLWRIDTNFIDVLRQVNRHAKTVVTLHTVLPYGTWQRSGFYDAIKAVADGIIVHTAEARANMAVATGSCSIVTIPHGTRLEDKGDRATGLQLLKIPEPYWDRGVIGLLFGFQGPGKNTVHTIRAFCESITHRYHDNGLLVVCGENCGDYFRELDALVAESGYGKRIFLRPVFTQLDDVKHIFAAADFGMLNTTSTSLSASGAGHVYARYGVPIAAAVKPIYIDIIRAGAVPFWLDNRDLHHPTTSSINVIGALVRDAQLRSDVGQSMRAYAEATSWDKIAALHEKFYREVVEQQR